MKISCLRLFDIFLQPRSSSLGTDLGLWLRRLRLLELEFELLYAAVREIARPRLLPPATRFGQVGPVRDSGLLRWAGGALVLDVLAQLGVVPRKHGLFFQLPVALHPGEGPIDGKFTDTYLE